MPDRPVHVLLVEDDEEDYMIAADLLNDAGGGRYTIDWVRTVDEALSKLDRCVHDVFLVDYRLGGDDGIDFVTEAIRRRCDAPIILLTGEGGRDADVAAMEAGAADFLNKADLTPAVLERSIRYALAHKRSERQRLEVVKAQVARREAEAEKRAAQEANAAKDQFLAVVSHELRTPLNAILGWSQVLRAEAERGDPAEVDLESLREGVETIERNARSQQQLIEDLLDVSRIIAGKVRIDPRPLRLRPAIDQAAQSVAPMARQRGVTLSVEGGEGLPPVVGDPDRLQQVMWNLLSNAVKFTPSGGRVRVLVADAGGRDGDARAIVTVTDDGRGISADDLPRIFDRFHQAGRTGGSDGPDVDARSNGLGLGLAIVRHLVELHDGTVEAASDGDGHGSTFTVTLPIARDLVAAE